MNGIYPFLPTQPVGRPESKTALLLLVDAGKTILLEEAFDSSILSAESRRWVEKRTSGKLT
jgi:hypothetical protein